jgi:hypothetical protein
LQDLTPFLGTAIATLGDMVKDIRKNLSGSFWHRRYLTTNSKLKGEEGKCPEDLKPLKALLKKRFAALALRRDDK